MEETQNPIQPTVEPTPKPSFLQFPKGRLYIFILSAVLLAAMAYTVSAVYLNLWPFQQEQIACTMEAKLCPDGSYVGRTGPKCEFAPCPTSSVLPTPDTSGWQTYRNEEYGFEFKYPGDFIVEEIRSSSGISIIRKEDKNAPAPPGVWLYFENNPKNLSLIEWWNSFGDKKEYSQPKNIIINGIPAIESFELEGYGSDNIIFSHNQDILYFVIIGIDESNQILSTFKFIN